MTPAQAPLEETGIVPRMRWAAVDGANADTNITVTGIRITDKVSVVFNVTDNTEHAAQTTITASDTIQISVTTTTDKLLVGYFSDPNAR